MNVYAKGVVNFMTVKASNSSNFKLDIYPKAINVNIGEQK